MPECFCRALRFHIGPNGELTSERTEPIAVDARPDKDGKGRWMDNVFIERLWRSVKYEEVYLKAYESIPEARTELGWYLAFHNGKRSHEALGRKTPDVFYFETLEPKNMPRERAINALSTGARFACVKGAARTRPWITPQRQFTTYRPLNSVQPTGATAVQLILSTMLPHSG